MEELIAHRNYAAKKAFTLAEVLITLAIIGVVAALTIPTVIRNYQKTQTISQFKKAYSALSRATNLVIAEYGPPDTWFFTDASNDETERLFLMYKPYLSVLKTCKNKAGCWSSDITKTLIGQTMLWAQSAGVGSNIYVAILKDGSALSIDMFGNNPQDYFGVIKSSKMQGTNMLFTVDINGAKKPNRSGMDVFHFVMTDKGLAPAGKDNNSLQCIKTNSTDRGGFDCAAKILKENDITYW